MPERRILAGGPVRQRPRILEPYLRHLEGLDPAGCDVRYLFVDDNDDAEASAMLRAWCRARDDRATCLIPQGLEEQPYVRGEIHEWRPDLMRRVAGLRNVCLQRARDGGYDALLMVDSDLCLRPETLAVLLAAGVDIVAEVFWTRFFPDAWVCPNVWVGGEYGLFASVPEDILPTRTEQARLAKAWMRSIKRPGLHRVGGLGACTLISAAAIRGGCNYNPIYNLGMDGEDRWFCVRAAVNGFQLYADSHCPPLHLYREAYLRAYPAWRARYCGGAAEPQPLAAMHQGG